MVAISAGEHGDLDQVFTVSLPMWSMTQATTTDRLVRCTQCRSIYVGQQTADGCVGPHGMTDCNQCGSDDFKPITLVDLGMD
jgi:hypothetical protein